MPQRKLKRVNLDNQTVQRILASALSCWSRDGYHGASLQQIADAAGVAKSLLHYHFASKEHLLIELQSEYSRRVALGVRARLAMSTPSVDSAFVALDQVWDAIVATRHQFPFALEVWRASLHNAAVRERLSEFECEISALFEEGIELALGSLRGPLALPAARMAEMLQVVLGGFELRLFLNPDIKRARRVFDDFKKLVQLAVAPARRRKK
jgi:AcrR family transcriptional regulator